jgi:hypothetical protein
LDSRFHTCKQPQYHLSHTSCPFCSGYFRDGVLRTVSRLASNCDLPNLSLPRSWDYRCNWHSAGRSFSIHFSLKTQVPLYASHFLLFAGHCSFLSKGSLSNSPVQFRILSVSCTQKVFFCGLSTALQLKALEE